MAILEAPSPGVSTPESERLEQIWSDTPGIAGFLTSVDHKRVGIRYFVTSFAFLLIGGIEALFLRVQLGQPESGVLSPEAYNQLMTMHGTTMIFLFNIPMVAAFGNYLVPLQIGARDMAFPRLNMFGYWILLLGGLFMYGSFIVDAVPDGGWFAYTPLTTEPFSAGAGLDFWAIGVALLGVSTTAGGINLIVTTMRLRAPGMSLNRMPIFVWGELTMALMIVFSFPAITLASVLLELDRAFGMNFFDVSAGGNAILYEHLFWIWGHPLVYILFIPAAGIISMVIPAFARRPIAGYPFVVAAELATGFLSFGLWIHHMFASGLPFMVSSFFTAVSLAIVIPSGMQVFAWLVTVARGRVKLEPPMLFAGAFIFLFVIGGISGVMTAIVPFDLAIHDSYFVVAHFHYVLIGATVFPIFAGIHFWFPKVTGRLYNTFVAKIAFWVMFVGFNVAFFPMHILGFLGMPRRVYTYEAGLGWDGANLISTIGAFMFASGILLMVVNFVQARIGGVHSAPNPWGAETLEWATSSPPPDFNYAGIPVVHSLSPLWDLPPGQRLPEVTEVGGKNLVDPEELEHVTLATSVMDADRMEVVEMPGPSFWPLVVALGLLGVAVSVLITSLTLAGISLAGILGGVGLWQWEVAER